MNEASGVAPDTRSVPAGRGLGWWTDAWALFMRGAGMWVLLGLVLMVIVAVLAFVPLLGAVALSLLLPVFVGSWMLATRKAEAGGALQVEDLFACFKGGKLTPLLVLGALLLAASVVIGLVMGLLGFGAAASVMVGGGGSGGVAAATGFGLVALLVGLGLGTLAAAAFWFAPALVVFHDVPPLDALKASAAASLKNLVPFLVYSLIYLLAAMVASLLFGLGWLLLTPLTLITFYLSYREVFGA